MKQYIIGFFVGAAVVVAVEAAFIAYSVMTWPGH